MPEFTAFLVAVGPMALAVTKAVDFVRDLLDKDDSWPRWVWILLAMVFGVGFALLAQLNMTALIADLSPDVAGHLTGVVGQVMTGLAIGGTASFWHNQMAARTRESTLTTEVVVP